MVAACLQKDRWETTSNRHGLLHQQTWAAGFSALQPMLACCRRLPLGPASQLDGTVTLTQSGSTATAR